MTLARLNYMALPGVGSWDGAMKDVGPQLRPYHDYLMTSLKAAERRKLVLGWRIASDRERVEFDRRLHERDDRRRDDAALARRRRDRRPPPRREARGHWIVLETAPGRVEEPETTFEAFYEAKEVFDDVRCGRDSGLARLDFDREGRALLLDQVPEPWSGSGEGREDPIPCLWLRADTYQLERQLHALLDLENAPSPRLAPLVRLACTRPTWDDVVVTHPVHDWVFLTTDEQDQLRDGTQEQRRFVEIGMNTPDFAILDGPPGSGKTTVICELIAQLARLGKRILLVASTHVAVDNVLERLLKWQDRTDEKLLLPIRIGAEDSVTKDVILPWTFRRLQQTWQDEIRDFLDAPGKSVREGGDAARRVLREAMSRAEKNESVLARLLVECSNLVCGTTIGILQHPAIKAARYEGEVFEPFDVMILDEASKTTFTEFLVPARHAARWIISGDLRQLSPYVDETELADNVQGLVPEDFARAAVHAFLASRHRRTVLGVADEDQRDLARGEAAARGVVLADLDAADRTVLRGVDDVIPNLLHADLVIGGPQTLRDLEHRLPEDALEVGGTLPELPAWEAARRAYASLDHRGGPPAEDEPEWASAVAWRLVRSYELRLRPEERGRHLEDLEALLPATLSHRWFEWRKMRPRTQDGRPETPHEALRRELHTVRRVALPSILELLQRGFEPLPGWRGEVALASGLPGVKAAQRIVSLSYQHRMHPHIAAFSRAEFYTPPPSPPAYAFMSPETPKPLLLDGRTMEQERQWAYTRYARRALWLEVAPARRRGGGRNTNVVEAERLLEELGVFAEWAATHPRADGRPWEAAALTFYRGQEKLLREMLQRVTAQWGNSRTFCLPRGKRAVEVTLCTVDRYQGHEADLVFLSFVKSGHVGFLNSPNRLNVALTRARYQIVLLGHRSYFQRCKSPLLESLAKSEHYRGDIGWEVVS